MIFSTPEFIFFYLPLVITGYFILSTIGAVHRWKHSNLWKLWLIATSFYFYSSDANLDLLLFVVSLTSNFTIGNYLRRITLATPTFSPGLILSVGIAGNLILFCYYKYTDFIIFNINHLFGTTSSLLGLALPLAISFYTFQQIAYLVDSYHSKIQDDSFTNYLLFVSFFPQLIAGPILRYDEIADQITKKRQNKLNWDNISSGLFLFGIGLFKKVIIANSFATFANNGYSSSQVLGTLQAWATSLSYTFQLYYDFSGYTDMAIGCALIFNIRLPMNFNSPYKALNIQDFWQRWHMTLSRWLRDYLYIPLGGNQKGYLRTLTNLLITFTIAGIWHGAGWTFIVWGTLHGVAMIVHRLWQTTSIVLPKAGRWFLTFFFINISWVFFRAENLSEALQILNGMFSLDFVAPEFVSNLSQLATWQNPVAFLSLNGPLITTMHLTIVIVIFPLVTFAGPNSMQILQFIPHTGQLFFTRSYLSAFALSLMLFVSFLTFIGNVSPGQFIYFNF